MKKGLKKFCIRIMAAGVFRERERVCLWLDIECKLKKVATALIVSCKLINSDTIPAILPLVNKLLNHSEATIRKKAIMVLQRFNELSPKTISDVGDKAKRMLCDKDPSVMGASLHLLLDLVEQDDGGSDFSDLVSSFVSILKQIIEHRLPKDYDYHRMPAPWTQIKFGYF